LPLDFGPANGRNPPRADPSTGTKRQILRDQHTLHKPSSARSATCPKSRRLPGPALKIRRPPLRGPGFPRVAAAGPGCGKRLGGAIVRRTAAWRADYEPALRRYPLGYPCEHQACACSSGTEMRVRLKSPPLVRVRGFAWHRIGLRIMVCGARCRDGHRCRQCSLRGKRRCRLHGGLSPGTPNPLAGYQALVRWRTMRRAMGLKASLGGRPPGRWAWRAKDHREMLLRCLDELIETLGPPAGKNES